MQSGEEGGSPAPESDKHVCHEAQGWTLSCPSFLAVPGTQGAGEVEKRGSQEPLKAEERSSGRGLGGVGKVKCSGAPAGSLF